MAEGRKTHKPYARVTEELLDSCIKAYKNGGTLAGIARRYHMSTPTLKSHLKKAGVYGMFTPVKEKRRTKGIYLTISEESFRFLSRVKNRSAFVDEVLRQLAKRNAERIKSKFASPK